MKFNVNIKYDIFNSLYKNDLIKKLKHTLISNLESKITIEEKSELRNKDYFDLNLKANIYAFDQTEIESILKQLNYLKLNNKDSFEKHLIQNIIDKINE